MKMQRTAQSASPLNDSAYKEKARRLELDALVLSHSLLAGQFRSLRHGVHGVDFAGVREYTPFDDARQIDWNATARSTKVYVKLFEEDRESQIFILLDVSRSMLTGGKRSRALAAKETAMLVSWAAQMRGIRVGGIIFDSEVRTVCPPKAGMDFIAKINALDERAAPESGASVENGTCIDRALAAALSVLRMRSAVFVLSDFRIASSLYEKPLAALAARHDVFAICLTDKTDTQFPPLGSVRFADAEGAGQQILPTSSAAFKRDWRRDGLQFLTSWKALCAKRGVFSEVLGTEDEALAVLLKIFKRESRAVRRA